MPGAILAQGFPRFFRHVVPRIATKPFLDNALDVPVDKALVEVVVTGEGWSILAAVAEFLHHAFL